MFLFFLEFAFLGDELVIKHEWFVSPWFGRLPFPDLFVGGWAIDNSRDRQMGQYLPDHQWILKNYFNNRTENRHVDERFYRWPREKRPYLYEDLYDGERSIQPILPPINCNN